MSNECKFSKLTVKQLQLGSIDNWTEAGFNRKIILSFIIYRHSSREESIFLLLHAYRMCGDTTHSPTTNVLTLFAKVKNNIQEQKCIIL